MHSIQFAGELENSQTKATIIRVLGSLAIGAGITLGLFAFMHSLIKQDILPIVEQEPVVVLSSILDVEDKQIIERAKPKPLPELKVKPVTPSEKPQVPDDSSNFSTNIELPSTSISKMAFNINEIDQQPRPLVRVNPSYPGTAASKGIEGFVKLSFSVSSTGEVVDINVIEAEPKNVFERNAKRALKKWRYQPKLVSGKPVGMEGLQVQLDFKLGGN